MLFSAENEAFQWGVFREPHCVSRKIELRNDLNSKSLCISDQVFDLVNCVFLLWAPSGIASEAGEGRQVHRVWIVIRNMEMEVVDFCICNWLDEEVLEPFDVTVLSRNVKWDASVWESRLVLNLYRPIFKGNLGILNFDQLMKTCQSSYRSNVMLRSYLDTLLVDLQLIWLLQHVHLRF